MTTNSPLTASLLAEYDQSLAMSSDYLDHLVAAFRNQRAQNSADGWPEVVSVVACSVWLDTEVAQDACASALAVAIMRLAGQSSE